MTWLTTLTTNNSLQTYYVSLTPEQYYECRFNQSIPAGTRVSESRQITGAISDLIVASVDLPVAEVKTSSEGLHIKRAVPAILMHEAGRLVSPEDLLADRKKKIAQFRRVVEGFREKSKLNKFAISTTEDPKLYMFDSIDDENVRLLHFGRITEVVQKIVEKRAELGAISQIPTWRSREMADLVRYDNAVVYLRNIGLATDPTKLQQILRAALGESQHTQKVSWAACLKQIHPQIAKIYNGLEGFYDLNWVKHMIQR